MSCTSCTSIALRHFVKSIARVEVEAAKPCLRPTTSTNHGRRSYGTQSLERERRMTPRLSTQHDKLPHHIKTSSIHKTSAKSFGTSSPARNPNDEDGFVEMTPEAIDALAAESNAEFEAIASRQGHYQDKDSQSSARSYQPVRADELFRDEKSDRAGPRLRPRVSDKATWAQPSNFQERRPRDNGGTYSDRSTPKNNGATAYSDPRRSIGKLPERDADLDSSRGQYNSHSIRDPKQEERFIPVQKDREYWQIQKAALKKKFGDQPWNPRKRLSPDALAGIRAIHQQFPLEYSTEVLARKFEVSPEMIRRILKSKWRPNTEEEIDRQNRWFKRGEKIWSKYAEQGYKAPAKWRAVGVGKKTTPKDPNAPVDPPLKPLTRREPQPKPKPTEITTERASILTTTNMRDIPEDSWL